MQYNTIIFILDFIPYLLYSLGPDINKSPWTAAEENLLIQAHLRIGNKWAEISKLFPGRTDNYLKNQYYSSMRRETRKAIKTLMTVPPPIPTITVPFTPLTMFPDSGSDTISSSSSDISTSSSSPDEHTTGTTAKRKRTTNNASNYVKKRTDWRSVTMYVTEEQATQEAEEILANKANVSATEKNKIITSVKRKIFNRMRMRERRMEIPVKNSKQRKLPSLADTYKYRIKST